MLLTSFVGAFVGLGAKPSRRQSVSSWLILLGGAHFLCTAMWNATAGLWTADTIDEFVESMIYGSILFSAPGVLAIVAGVLLRSPRDGSVLANRELGSAPAAAGGG